ncbi:nucleoporin NUP49/NSP49 [Emericellopsis cladophorae]|uniref:Nucleoporin NUP49/NSP49 n=1 Tax=Emericellopsis cladophorae TaxID=2686198 RepID=A0A9P9XTW7_9HYPO|nr:nucleoporin NUP49/NSP49 [Emericellopsis cladophorae]KAI6777763.1 nucleoporin NUP49/NSP49 [Emericellopsis cladophorae]
MSLARSASGPAGLSINTGAANSLSATQPAPSGGLFGAPASATTSTAPTTNNPTAGGMSLFGAKPATGQTGSSLFGGGAATNTNAQSSSGAGGLFGGGSATTQSNTGGGGGLFGGGSATNTQSSTGGGGLFGGGASTANTANAAQSTGGGLFGSKPAQSNPTTATQGSSLFGGGQNTAQQSSTSGGLFGGASNQGNTTGQSTTSAFGQTQAKPSLFGASQTQPQSQQQQQPQQQQQQSATQINYADIRPRTRFDDLRQPIQDEITLIEKGITRVIKMKDQISQFMPQHGVDVEQLARDVAFVEQKYRTVQNALQGDVVNVKGLQDRSKRNISDGQLNFRAVDNLKLPMHYHQTGLFKADGSKEPSGDAQDLISYFNRIADDVERQHRKLEEYRVAIERDMPGVENGLYEQVRAIRDRHEEEGSGVAEQLGQVLSALREMGTAIINEAGKIADTRERLSRLQAGTYL